MNCNHFINPSCGCCKNFVKTTSIALKTQNLILTIPNAELTNCKTFCINLAQVIPAGVTSNTIVAININGNIYTVITPCCANALYADQLCSGKTYCVKFGTDTKCFIYKGAWRLKCTNHVFLAIPIIVTSTAAVAENTTNEEVHAE